jgi:hypothetical protein
VGRALLRGTAAIIGIALALAAGVSSAFAYQPGAIGYDISFPQCGGSYPTSTPPPDRNQVPPPVSITASRSRTMTAIAPPVPQRSGRTRTTASGVSRLTRTFGIIGVDSGNPFISNTHPGNPCLADEYAHTPNPALYVNTGYDPSYEQPDHTTTDCTTKSQNILTDAAHQRAWAVGCSEAQKDLAYVASQGIHNNAGWWLDVEPANSWCGQHGVICDLSLNQYSIQGLIDTLLASGALPVGIYSNTSFWSAIVGSNRVHGQTADWYASPASTAQGAAPYCTRAFSFTGDPVKISQFVSGGFDYDYAC